MAIEAARMRDGPPATDLVSRAAGGDKQAWDALVERYIPLVWSICRRHRLDNVDAREVSQTVWRQLAGRLGTLRDLTALAGWLATTTQRECDLIRRAARRPGRDLLVVVTPPKIRQLTDVSHCKLHQYLWCNRS